MNKNKLFRGRAYHPSSAMAQGRPRTPAPTMAVTLWKAEYHHFAFLEEVIGSQASIAFSFSDRVSTCDRSQHMHFRLIHQKKYT